MVLYNVAQCSNSNSTSRPKGLSVKGISSGTVVGPGVNAYAQPARIDTVPRRRVQPMLSDSEMLRSTDGILSRLSRTGMSVVASSQALGWEDIRSVITEGRLEDFFDYSAPFHIVAFNLKGDPTVEWKRGSRFSRFQAQAGELLITPSGEGHSIRQLRPNVAFHCCLGRDRLQSLAEQEWNAHGSTIEIVEAYSRDVELWNLGQRLAARLRSPIPGSRLFAEALVTQIAIELLWKHSSLPGPSSRVVENLTNPRLRRVIDFLHASFWQEITLDGLAEVAGLSPNYFLHAFKQSTGRTPHRYLTELRIARARELLQDPHRSIVEHQPGRRLLVAEPSDVGLPPLPEDDPGGLSPRGPRAASQWRRPGSTEWRRRCVWTSGKLPIKPPANVYRIILKGRVDHGFGKRPLPPYRTSPNDDFRPGPDRPPGLSGGRLGRRAVHGRLLFEEALDPGPGRDSRGLDRVAVHRLRLRDDRRHRNEVLRRITVLAEGVACWIPIPFFSIMAEVTVMIVGFFVLFDLSKWQTYSIVLLNFVVLFGAHYLMANYINPSRSFGSRPPAQFSERRTGMPTLACGPV